MTEPTQKAPSVDLCFGASGQGDGPYEINGLPAWFTCADLADGLATFPCTGSKHVSNVVVICSCKCHLVPRAAEPAAQPVVTTPSPVEVRDALRTLNTVRDLPDDHPDRQAAVAAKQQVIRRIEEGQHG